MACIITYKNNKYSQQEFEKYFKNNFNEFFNEFLSQDIEGFKKFILNINSQEENIELNLPSKINQFYTNLTQEEKNKIGDIEQIYNEQTFPMEETEFIDMLKCKI